MMLPDLVRLGIATLRAIGAAIGGFGIFALWASFYVPPLGVLALLTLGLATAIALLSPQS